MLLVTIATLNTLTKIFFVKTVKTVLIVVNVYFVPIVALNAGAITLIAARVDAANEDQGRPRYVKNPLKFHKSNKLSFKKNPSSRFLAAEIEVSHLDNSKHASGIEKIIRQWGASLVEDGSLPDTGFEINTAPANGDLFIEQISQICTALRKADAQVNGDCGMHVHIDARDFTAYDIRRLSWMYDAVEEILFNMVSESRGESQFCAPRVFNFSKDRLPIQEVKGEIITRVYNEGPGKKYSKNKSRKHGTSRYYALNLHSWFYQGTIECRLFGGTTNSYKITHWAMMWGQLLDYCSNHTDEEILDIIQNKKSISLLHAFMENREDLIKFINKRVNTYGDTGLLKVA